MASSQLLLEKHVPRFHFHPDERYFPQDWRTALDPSSPSSPVIRQPPILGHVVDDANGSTKYLDYWIYYGFNGDQGFRLTPGFFARRGREFSWKPLANHEADWENVTVKLNARTGEVLSIFLSAHGRGNVVTTSITQGAARADVYVALNSHANHIQSSFARDYNAVFDGVMPYIIPVITLGTYRSLELGDRLSARGLVWDPASNLVDLTDTVSASFVTEPWYTFTGPWGRAVDQTKTTIPPVPLFGLAMFCVIVIAKWLGVLKTFVSANEPAAGSPFTRAEYKDPSLYWGAL